MKGDVILVLLFSFVQKLTAENVLVIQGGVSKLRLDDIANSEITNVSEAIGCQENISLPNYPRNVFGTQLSFFKNMFWSCGGANFEETFSDCYIIDSRLFDVCFPKNLCKYLF